MPIPKPVILAGGFTQSTFASECACELEAHHDCKFEIIRDTFSSKHAAHDKVLVHQFHCGQSSHALLVVAWLAVVIDACTGDIDQLPITAHL